MTQVISTQEKKYFLTWVLQNVRFNDREAYWLLNYIVTHEAILKKIKIVEQVEKTPRGIKFSDVRQTAPAFQMFKHHLILEHGEQIFHEMRSNMMFDLYLEFNLENSWQNPELIRVLEDNPYASWNTHALELEKNPEVLNELEARFNEQALRNAIDEALEEGNSQLFTELSEKLNKQLKEL